MRILKVQGKGSVSAEPDIVTLSFGVDTRAKGYADCLEALNERTEDLRQSLEKAKLERAELKTSSFNIRVDSRYKDGKHIFVGYVASHRLHIELPMDKDLLNQVFRHISVGQSGAEITLSFSVKDKEGMRQRVLADAVRVAKQNARGLAEAAEVTLGDIQQIDYGWSEVHFFDHESSMVADGAMMASKIDLDIEPEDIRAQDTVTVVYEISE